MKRKPAAAPRMPPLLESLADRIRSWRKRRSMTQTGLASRSGVSVSFVSALEHAERCPSYERLLAIAHALQIPASELLRIEDEPSRDDGVYRELVDFARKLHLSRRQVERLIAVGRIVFGQESKPVRSGRA